MNHVEVDGVLHNKKLKYNRWYILINVDGKIVPAITSSCNAEVGDYICFEGKLEYTATGLRLSGKITEGVAI